MPNGKNTSPTVDEAIATATDNTRPTDTSSKVQAAAAASQNAGGGETTVDPERTEEEKARAAAEVEAQREHMREISGGKGVIPPMSPAQIVAKHYPDEKTVKMLFPKPIRLTLRSHAIAEFPKGVHSVPAPLADPNTPEGRWLAANGAEKVD